MTENITTTSAPILETIQATRDFQEVLGKWSDELAEALVDADATTKADVLRRIAATCVALVETTSTIAIQFTDAGVVTDGFDEDSEFSMDEDDPTSLDDVVGALEDADSALHRVADMIEKDSEDMFNQ